MEKDVLGGAPREISVIVGTLGITKLFFLVCTWVQEANLAAGSTNPQGY